MEIHAEIYAALKYHETAVRAHGPFFLSGKMTFSPFTFEI